MSLTFTFPIAFGSSPKLRFYSSRQVRTAGTRSRITARSLSHHERELATVGSANLDWSSLSFQYSDTCGHVIYRWRDGRWDEGQFSEDPNIEIHVAATALHYGQSCFEGMKAFAGRDGRVRLYRPYQHAKRMAESAARLCMPQVSEDMFIEAIGRAVRENLAFVPPYGSQCSLYIRPILLGSGPRIGIGPSDEYAFIVTVMPVGNYYSSSAPVRAVVTEEFQRAAVDGLGSNKVGANYAADLLPCSKAKEAGFSMNLYLDPIYSRYIEEFGTSNFIAVQGNRIVTPNSRSVLPGITRLSLMQIAEHFSMEVVERRISIEEVPEFDEVAACGTGTGVTPINTLAYRGQLFTLGTCHQQDTHSRLMFLMDKIRQIQVAAEEDIFGWTLDVLEL